MTSETSVSRLSAPLIALFLTFTAMYAPVHAAEDFRKVICGVRQGQVDLFRRCLFQCCAPPRQQSERGLLSRALARVEAELREGFDPSNPQMAGGEKVEPPLVARPLGARGAVPK